jgi:hypothetical protein
MQNTALDALIAPPPKQLYQRSTFVNEEIPRKLGDANEKPPGQAIAEIALCAEHHSMPLRVRLRNQD